MKKIILVINLVSKEEIDLSEIEIKKISGKIKKEIRIRQGK